MRHTSRLLVQCTRIFRPVDSLSSLHKPPDTPRMQPEPRASHSTELLPRLFPRSSSSSSSSSSNNNPRTTLPKLPDTLGLGVCRPHRVFPNDLVSVLRRSIRSSCSRCTWDTSRQKQQHQLNHKQKLLRLHQPLRQTQQQQQQQHPKRKPKRTSRKTPGWYILTMKSVQRKNWPVCQGTHLLRLIWGKP